jgi:transcriptional antiterminator
MKKGTKRKANTFVHYRLVEGLYAHIRSAQFRTQEF